jgi:hypothetical protein
MLDLSPIFSGVALGVALGITWLTTRDYLKLTKRILFLEMKVDTLGKFASIYLNRPLDGNRESI